MMTTTVTDRQRLLCAVLHTKLLSLLRAPVVVHATFAAHIDVRLALPILAWGSKLNLKIHASASHMAARSRRPEAASLDEVYVNGQPLF